MTLIPGAHHPIETARRVAHEETLRPAVSLARGRTAIWFIAAAMTAFGILFTLVRSNRTADFDHAITVTLQRRRRPWISRLLHAVSWPGFPPQSRFLPLALPTLIALLGFPLEAIFQGLGWGTGVISTTFKRRMQRPRPSHPAIRVAVARIGGSSFPSGHVINYIGVYGFLAYLVHTNLKPAAIRRSVVALLGTLIALVGPSRIYLGHHWLTDVLASYLLGFSYLIGLAALYQRFKRWSLAR